MHRSTRPDIAPDSSPKVSEARTVMVVDDMPEQATLARRILQRAGYVVLTALSGQEALEVLDGLEGELDLLITDLRMPRMTGPELAREVRKRHPLVRLMFVSGGSLVGADLPAGALLLGKPHAPNELVQAARQALDSEL